MSAALGGVNMTCGFCGHADDLDAFCSTTISGQLPRNRYQCQACRRAVEKRYGEPTVYPSGFIMPGQVTMVEVEAVL